MKNITIMIKPASSLCNMRCRYCFYEDVSEKRKDASLGIMTQENVQEILSNIFCDMEKGDTVSFLFQGGEPTLAGLEYYKSFAEEVQVLKGDVKVNYALQTNGLNLDKEWCIFFRDNGFLIGLSLDMLAEIHNDCRIDASKEGTYTRVKKAQKLMDKYGVEYNILSVLTEKMANRPDDVWEYICKENIRYIQFIPCLGELDGTESSYRLKPEGFAFFYTKLFSLWSEAFERGEYYSIKLFDDLICLLADGSRNACGITGRCVPQLVVEADGSVYPCDFYALDEYCIGNLAKENVQTILRNSLIAEFGKAGNKELGICKSCPYVNMCHGGCKRMRREVCGDIDADKCGYREFLDRSIHKLQLYAYRERMSRREH